MSKYMNLKEKSYEIIKQNIINLVYMPGEYLEEKKLSASLEVSRTPMREALSRLEEEGWVKIYPRKGIFVSVIDEILINNVFEARKILEVSALKLTIKKLSKIKLELLKESLDGISMDDEKRLDQIDDKFHSMILSFYSNFFMNKVSINILEHTKRIKIFSLGKKLKARIIQSTEEHLELLDLLIEGNIEESEKLLYTHLERAQIYYLKILIV
ncbi:MAG TPA: hypothetical protein DCR90_02785 [Fusobacteriaceae bacterium]|mgnify:CR=1 FL=1|nr:hypothetical protein [Fusobacteriaceae bacterium]